MTVNKDIKTFEHELVSLKVDDVDTKLVYDFFIERNGAMPQTNIPSVSIVSAGTVGPTAAVSGASSVVASECVAQVAQTSEQKTATTSQSPEAFPLLPLNDTSTTAPSTPTSSTHSLPSMPTSQSNAPQRPLYEKLTLASVRTLHSSAQSLTGVAEDRILGRASFVTEGRQIDGNWETGIVIREIGQVVDQLRPKGLSLLELGILVHEIHLEAPEYHLLANQCYWFIRTICIIIILLYGDELNPVKLTKTKSPKSPNQYLPNLSGRWKNMLIAAPDDEVIGRIITKFTKRQDEIFSEVKRAHAEKLRRDEELVSLRNNEADLQRQINSLAARLKEMGEADRDIAGPSSYVG